MTSCNVVLNAEKEKQIINIKELGAKGDGVSDDWEVIQKTIDKLAISGGGTIFFPKGTYVIYDKSIVVWGQNISLMGDNCRTVKIIKKGKAGYFGDCIDVTGRINGYKYYGYLGNYKDLNLYNGKTEKAKNIRLKNLTIDCSIEDTEEKLKGANCLGIINVDDLIVSNCIVQNAPQTNVGIVNDTERFSNEAVVFNHCIFQLSNQHNVRVITYNKGEILGNYVQFNDCKFLQTKNTDKAQKELMQNEVRVSLWYRGAYITGKSSLEINNCFFDDSGIIYINENANGFSIKDSQVSSSLNLQHSSSLEGNPHIIVNNTKFALQGEADVFMQRKVKNTANYKSTFFGTVYPSALKIESY